MPIDFRNITATQGYQHRSFEELCCQNARHLTTVPSGSRFVRYRGDGGDGGVECIWRLPNGDEWGWQAKYVFSLPDALRLLTESFETALQAHPNLVVFVVCLPFDLTGPTRRKRRDGTPNLSECDRFDKWREEQIAKTQGAGRNIEIRLETASTILDILQGYDSGSGRLRYWFDVTVLSDEWFTRHVAAAIEHAKPRYTPELTIEVPVAKALEALCGTDRWFNVLADFHRSVKEVAVNWSRAVDAEYREGMWDAAFPEILKDESRTAAIELQAIVDNLGDVCARLARLDHVTLSRCIADEIAPKFRTLRSQMAAMIDAQHGQGSADSYSFRQFQSEYNVSFPTANLDRADAVLKALDSLDSLLISAEASVASEKVMILTGEAGAGKTHAICDMASQRMERRLRTIILFGEQFQGTGDPWIDIIHQLGLPGNLTRDELLAALDAAGEATGYVLLFCIDGINETVPRTYWFAQLSKIVSYCAPYAFIRLCVSCRSSYVFQVLPDHKSGWRRVEHKGFSGFEYDACKAFFEFYGLRAPAVPILQPDFANPLFLRLICTAARDEGLSHLPVGWHGIFTAVTVLMKSKGERFSRQFGISPKHGVPDKALQAIVAAARDFSRSAVPFDMAFEIVQKVVPSGVHGEPLLDWLIGESLLLVDGNSSTCGDQATEHVRIAFERLGDHLLAASYLSQLNKNSVGQAFATDGFLRYAVVSAQATAEHQGLLEALCIQVPERFGLELLHCINSDDLTEDVRKILIRTTMRTMLWRDPSTITAAARQVALESLSTVGQVFEIFDPLIEVGVQTSALDAHFFHERISSVPMTQRDAWWCLYLHASLERHGPVERLLHAAIEIDPLNLETEVVDRWATMLLWFCGASDRRVRDLASKGLVRITKDHAEVWSSLIRRFSNCDDEYIIERCLLCAYGAVIINRNYENIRSIASAAFELAFREPANYQNAAVRDHARCILDFAAANDALPDSVDPHHYLPPYSSEWPLVIPTAEDIAFVSKDAKEFPKLHASCTFDDFSRYTLTILRGFEDTMSTPEMGRWICQQVVDMGYGGGQAAMYDNHMLYAFGGGRGRPTWAERIGKKYQWIALARLAARLTDHAIPHYTWGPPSLPYVEGRDLDPTLLAKSDNRSSKTNAWWQPVVYDWTTTPSEDDAWVVSRDVPDPRQLIEATDSNGVSWLAINNQAEWQWSPKGPDDNDNYNFDGERHCWTRITSFLVPETHFAHCWRELKARQLVGEWVPDGPEFHDGFMGEYPWAMPFAAQDDVWGMRELVRDLPSVFTPTTCSVSSSYDADAFQTSPITVRVPHKIFFDELQLNWDRRSGYCDELGNLAFQDPSLHMPGPGALLIAPGTLNWFLAKTNQHIIWIVQAEKLVYGDNARLRLKFTQYFTLANDELFASEPVETLD